MSEFNEWPVHGDRPCPLRMLADAVYKDDATFYTHPRKAFCRCYAAAVAYQNTTGEVRDDWFEVIVRRGRHFQAIGVQRDAIIASRDAVIAKLKECCNG